MIGEWHPVPASEPTASSQLGGGMTSPGPQVRTAGKRPAWLLKSLLPWVSETLTLMLEKSGQSQYKGSIP